MTGKEVTVSTKEGPLVISNELKVGVTGLVITGEVILFVIIIVEEVA